jgi:general secretion pathway protein B
MSYILDALRRADAERERDPGRGIHAQPVPLPAEAARRTPLWIAAGATVLLLLVAFVLLLRPSPRVSQHLNMPPPNAPMSRKLPPAP